MAYSIYLLCTGQGAYETSNAHERDEERLDDGLPFLNAFTVGLRETVNEVLEEQHGRNLTSVVSEEKAAEGGRGSEEQGLEATFGAIDLERPVKEELGQLKLHETCAV